VNQSRQRAGRSIWSERADGTQRGEQLTNLGCLLGSMTVIGLVLVLSLTLAPFATEAQQVGKVLPNRLARPGRLADSRVNSGPPCGWVPPRYQAQTDRDSPLKALAFFEKHLGG
jgi:hypothetical protein